MPNVFISYSHDSENHKRYVRELSERLRGDGLDTTIDQYISSPEKDWLQWMAKHIRDSDFVILICTETYQKRVEGREDAGKGLGVKWEALHILSDIYKNDSGSTKFIPVIFEATDRTYIPDAVFGFSYFDLSQKNGYLNLSRMLWSELAIPRPPLGNKPDFNKNQFDNDSESRALVKISEALSTNIIYNLPREKVESMYSELDVMDSGFANYLWVVLYHEYCKRHVPPVKRSKAADLRKIKAMKFLPNDNERKIVGGINFATNISKILNAYGGAK